MRGKIKTLHIDRKLDEMKKKFPTRSFTSKEIASYCGASDRLIKRIQSKAMHKLKKKGMLWEMFQEMK